MAYTRCLGGMKSAQINSYHVFLNKNYFLMYKNEIFNLLSISILKCLCERVIFNHKLSNGTILLGSDSNGTLREVFSEIAILHFLERFLELIK